MCQTKEGMFQMKEGMFQMNLLTGHIVENSWSTWVNISPAPNAANSDHVTVRIVELEQC